MSTSPLWELEPHTVGKHLILKAYLDAWLPILGMTQGRILFIDGFSGPGKYIGGEPGSPLIALQSFRNHTANTRIGEVLFYFIDDNPSRVKHLKALIPKAVPNLPPNCKYEIIQGKFDQEMSSALDELEKQKTSMAPAFVMIDPFGVSGTPMDVISRILSVPKCEVYISFMYSSINRFRQTPEFESHLDKLFGCRDWRDGNNLPSEERKDSFYSLYKQQLKYAGAKQVIYFELYKGNRLIYAIFFATQSLKGCDEMKKAIWKIIPEGNYKFKGSNAEAGQLSFELQHNFQPLQDLLVSTYRLKGWVSVDEIESFLKTDQTIYHSGHLKSYALKPMELNGLLEIKESTRRRKRTYPTGTMLRFI
ncbi:MAG: three-Cys-motif partner protein TcmP [Gemmatimonadetes bacterium]|nr:three-Cys-motif partner protein TcmP [Gemmatimonadota bacterium]